MNKIYTQYSPTQKGRLHNCKKNVIHISSGDTFRHEMTKSAIAYLVHKYGDFKWDTECIEIIKVLEKKILNMMEGWPEETTDFLTEAWTKEGRRVDLVNLRDDTRIEIETDHKVDKKKKWNDPQTFNIYI